MSEDVENAARSGRESSKASGDAHYRARRELPDSDSAPRIARRWLHSLVGERGPFLTDSQEYVISCLASELVTNAVKHAAPRERGRREFGIEVRAGADTIRVAVTDPDPAPPQQRAPDYTAESGRGLMLVAAQAKEWGTCPLASGKSVWFSVALRAAD